MINEMKIVCYLCDKTLKEKGALIFSPPQKADERFGY